MDEEYIKNAIEYKIDYGFWPPECEINAKTLKKYLCEFPIIYSFIYLKIGELSRNAMDRGFENIMPDIKEALFEHNLCPEVKNGT